MTVTNYITFFLILNLAPLLCRSELPTGSLSLDAGYDGPDYQDENGIWWTSDSPFLINGNAGKTAQIANQSGPLQSLRYFPGPLTKYCYRLPNLTSSTSYFIRFTALYANYDLLSTPPVFAILLDANVLYYLTLSNDDGPLMPDYFFMAQRSFVDVCFSKVDGVGIPFINSIELRPLATGMYITPLSTGHGLSSAYRIDCGLGLLNRETLRYPFDPYDRLWEAYDVPLLVATNETVKSTSIDSEAVPSEVMRTALTALPNTTIVNGTLPFQWNSTVYTVLYFAEIENVGHEGERVFDIYINAEQSNISKLAYSGLDIFKSVGRLSTLTVSFSTPITVYDDKGGLYLELRSSSSSSRPPLINSLETYIYSPTPYLYSSYPNDVDAINQIRHQQWTNLNDWTGDPCMPRGFNWEWLTCSSNGNNSRIIEMNLSGFNLVGEVPPTINQLTSLQNISLDNNKLVGSIPDLSMLTQLQKLKLDNNSLSGPIPDTLSKLPSLMELSLENNNLTGIVPDELIKRQLNGTLILRIAGNPLLQIPPTQP